MEILEQEDVQLPLARLFNTASAKVLDFLLTNEGLGYTDDQISALAAIPNRTLQRALQTLLSEQVIKRDKKNGRTYRYTANTDSPHVGALLDYVNAVLVLNLESSIKNAGSK